MTTKSLMRRFVAYGATVAGVATYFGISHEEAKQMLDKARAEMAADNNCAAALAAQLRSRWPGDKMIYRN